MEGEAQNQFANNTLRMRHKLKGSRNGVKGRDGDDTKKKGLLANASFKSWRDRDLSAVLCVFAASLLFFIVEYNLRTIPPSSPPFDLGDVVTQTFHRLLASIPNRNTRLAVLNTVVVGMQPTYIVWAWVVEGRPRATISAFSALFMFTCRGILGYSTQLLVPEGFFGLDVDFLVGNVSFFLFYSGHVAALVIASLDMRRTDRFEMAGAFHGLNILQIVVLLGTKGHYTIDLVVGMGAGILAGILFDYLVGEYDKCKKNADAYHHS